MKSINQPLWERRRFGEVRRNYLKEGLEQYGHWDKLDEKSKQVIEKAIKI